MKVEVVVPNKPYGFCGREATLNWKEKLRPVLSADWLGCLMNWSTVVNVSELVWLSGKALGW